MSTSRSQHSCITTSPSLSSEANSKYEGSNNSSSDDESVSSTDLTLQTCEQIKKQLMSRWRYPTLTIHSIHVPMDNPTIISHCARSAVSMRIVPNQSITEICRTFEKYVRHTFQNLKSENDISVTKKKKMYIIKFSKDCLHTKLKRLRSKVRLIIG